MKMENDREEKIQQKINVGRERRKAKRKSEKKEG